MSRRDKGGIFGLGILDGSQQKAIKGRFDRKVTLEISIDREIDPSKIQDIIVVVSPSPGRVFQQGVNSFKVLSYEAR